MMMNHVPVPSICCVTQSGFASCGRKVRARSMGPARRVGKNDTKKAKSVSERVAGICRRYTSII